MENPEMLVRTLCDLPRETTWVEFKHDNYDPQMIGEDISALANSAVLEEKQCAFMLWGIDDKTHEIVGTIYDLQTLKKGNQELENWLRSLLSPNADFEFHTVEVNNKTVGVLTIYRAANHPVTFEKTDYIRVGSYTRKLREFPSLQAQLWEKLADIRFEDRFAKQDLTLQEALQFLNHTLYFDINGIPQPSDMNGVAHYMLEERILVRLDNGLYAITNLGAILFGKKLSDFSRIARKALRIVRYRGENRLHILKEETIQSGYVSGFDYLIKYIEALIFTQEPIVGALRERKAVYPLIAIREAVANALIHQEFSVTGTGPLIEVFDSRLEITNPGTPLVDVFRIVDNPPKSRNERVASMMRRLRMCEELGTGWDKIVVSCEMAMLPAPKITLYEDSVRVTLFSAVSFADISLEDRIWACYLHACIKQVQGEFLTNKSLRERFGVGESSSASISRLIKEAVCRNIIKPLDPDTAPRYMKYVPFWA